MSKHFQHQKDMHLQEIILKQIDEQENEIEFTFINYVKTSIYIALSMMIDLLPVSIGYYFLKKYGSQLEISSFGFGVSYMNFVCGVLYQYADYFGILGSKSFGEQKYKKFMIQFYQVILIQIIFAIICFMCLLYSEQILSNFDLPKNLIKLSSRFIKYQAYERMLDGILTTAKMILVAQNKVQYFVYISLFSIFFFFILDFSLTTIFKWRLKAYAFSRYIKTIIEFIVVIYISVKDSPQQFWFVPKWKNIEKGIFQIFKNSLYSILSSYGEVISLEITVILIGTLQDLDKIIAWVGFINICYYLFFLGLGQAGTLRTHLQILRGQLKIDKIFEIIHSYLIYAYIMNFIVSIFIFFFAENFASIFTNQEKPLEYLVHILRIFAIFCCFYLNRTFLGVLIRVMDFYLFRFVLCGIVYPIMILFASSFFVYVCKLGYISVLLSFVISDLFVYLIMFSVYYSYKEQWKIGLYIELEDYQKIQELSDLN